MHTFTFSPSIAVTGGGPVGLALSLQLAKHLPDARITLLDAQPLEPTDDPRAVALSLGSMHTLERLGVWAGITPTPHAIEAVHVSQQQSALWGWPRVELPSELHIRAVEEGVAQLGAVLSYGALIRSLQAAWLQACALAPQRLRGQWGVRVQALKAMGAAVEVDAGGVAENFDLVVVAQGGVFGAQPSKPWQSAYGQTAWVGEVSLSGATPGMAFERFTQEGPLALLPLSKERASLVWCVQTARDEVRDLSSTQRSAVLNTLLPRQAGRVTQVSDLKAFPLGLSVEPRLVHGRVVRIGNAAQTLHPVAGQGLNLGLRDAHQLSLALAQHGAMDSALQTLDRQRAWDRLSTIAITDFLARSFTWARPGLSLWRGLGLVGLQQVKPMRSLLARQMMFGGGY